MAATIITSSAAAAVVFGCTAETGIIINSYSRNVTRDAVDVSNSQGDIVATARIKPTAAISLEGTLNGTTGVAAAVPGVALVIASTSTGSGITGGSIVVNGVTRSETSEGFVTLSIDATQYPLL